MKKHTIWIVIALCGIFLGIILTFIFSFKGTPWKRYQVKKEGIAYIKNKYGAEFYNLEVYYDYDTLPPKSGYSVWGCAKQGKDNTGFKVEMPKVGDRDTYTDTYLEMLWKNEIDNELDLYVKQIYGEDARAGVGVFNGPIINFNYSIDKVPKYVEVKDKVVIDINVYMNYYFESKDYDNEVEKAFKIVKFVNEKEYIYEDFEFIYGLHIEGGQVKYFNIPYDKVKYIENVDDLKSIFNSKK